MKTFVLIVSQNFPKTHIHSGESTGFVENIQNLFQPGNTKKHTLRSNYKLWKNRADLINSGQAVLSIRYWSGKPYSSKQIEICELEKIGIEKLEGPDNLSTASVNGKMIDWRVIASNDGLSFEDFCEWFKYRQTEPMAIIQFTEFRYSSTNIRL